MASKVRKPQDRLVTTRILLLRPSTAPLEISPLARNQFSISGSWARSIRATFFIGSSRLRMARMLRAHEPLILNWFRAKGEISNGAVEGLNNKIRVVTRRSYGFRTFDAMEIALYHNLGRLPEPESPHKFC